MTTSRGPLRHRWSICHPIYKHMMFATISTPWPTVDEEEWRSDGILTERDQVTKQLTGTPLVDVDEHPLGEPPLASQCE